VSTIVTLVHGTWAPKAPWTQEGSYLRAALTKSFGESVIFRPYSWSGGNSFGARSSAAEGLRTFLKEGLKDYPESRQLVVAHSHGGNIVLYALRDKELAQSIDSVVFLSTPFIIAQPRQFGPNSKLVTELAVVMVSLLAGLAVGITLATVLNAAASYWAIVFLIVTALVAWAAWKMLNMLGGLWNKYATAWAEDVKVVPPDSNTKLLVIRPTGDEVADVMASVHLSFGVMTWAWKILALIAIAPLKCAGSIDDWASKHWHRRLAVGIFLWGITMSWVHYQYPTAEHYRIALFGIGLGCSLLMAAIFGRDTELLKAVGFLSVAVIVPLGFVFASLLVLLSLAPMMLFNLNRSLRDWKWFLAVGVFLGPIDVSGEPLLPGADCKQWQLPPDDVSGLRHSSTYQNPLAIEQIVKWVGPAV